ncbi:MAG: hypothetical protein PHE49_09545 [bacterium]|nr:hypothetical protein [bacterium]
MKLKEQPKEQSKELTVDQRQKLEDWQKKIKNGEAIKEAKNLMLEIGKAECDPDYNLNKIAEKIIPALRIKNEEISDEDRVMIRQAVTDLGFENDLSIMESVEDRYRGMMINLRRELIKEYDCKSYGEKALVDMAVSAYARNFTFNKRLLFLDKIKTADNEINGFITALGKEIDRANRHFITALEVLRQFKQPELKVNVKTNNAFISQNQQFNNNQNKQDERVEAK